MGEFVKVASLSEISDPGMLSVEVDGNFVIICRYNGDVSCIDDVCTHDGGTLSDGELGEHCVICPRHGAKFDIATGKALCMPATQNTLAHEAKVEGDEIHVKLNSELE